MAFERTPARIAQLYFKYSDPNVSVGAEANTVEHETIDDTIVVQQLGRRAERITVDGVVAEPEAGFIDLLPTFGIVSLRTERWSGDVIVRSTNSDPMQAVDNDGEWLYDVTIECIEVEEGAPSLVEEFEAIDEASNE